MRLPLFAAFVAVTVPLLAASQSTPPSTPEFRSAVNYIQLPVRVLDSRGAFIAGLAESDFQVLEDGVRQSITVFKSVEIPVRVGNGSDRPTGASDIPGEEAIARADGRVFVFVVDDFHLEPGYTLKLRNLLRDFISKQMSVTDVAAIVLTSGARVQDFTTDRTRLIRAVDTVIGEFDPDMDKIGMGLGRLQHQLTQRMVVSSVRETSKSLAAIQGRHKVLVLVTPDSLCKLIEADSNADDCSDAADAAIRADVSIYTVDPRGLVANDRSRAENSNPNSVFGDNGPQEVPSRGAARAAFGLARSEFRGPLDGAIAMAEATGGFGIVNTNNFRAAFDRLVRENSSYYVIGYYSSNSRTDGKWHRHQIVVDHRGARVFHRPGYYASRF